VPILMTALATGLASLPLVVSGLKPGHEFESPLAVVILGGLTTSTLLNLFLLPPPDLRFVRRTPGEVAATTRAARPGPGSHARAELPAPRTHIAHSMVVGVLADARTPTTITHDNWSQVSSG